MITTFTKAQTRLLAAEATAALEAVAARHGTTLTYKGGTYDTSFAALRFEFAVGEGGREAADFKRWALMLGLKETDLGRTFTARGATYTVVGYVPRGRYRILAKRGDGRTFRFLVSEVVRLLGEEK